MNKLRSWLKRDRRKTATGDAYVEVTAGSTSARVVIWEDGWANVLSDRGDFEDFVESPGDLAKLLAEAGLPAAEADHLWMHFVARNVER